MAHVSIEIFQGVWRDDFSSLGSVSCQALSRYLRTPKNVVLRFRSFHVSRTGVSKRQFAYCCGQPKETRKGHRISVAWADDGDTIWALTMLLEKSKPDYALKAEINDEMSSLRNVLDSAVEGFVQRCYLNEEGFESALIMLLDRLSRGCVLIPSMTI